MSALTLPLLMVVLDSSPVAEASVPPTPSGWTLVWSDDFTGAANTGVSSANWIYDIGTSYPGGAPNWGTGEIETMTNSTANVYQDGAGNLNIKPIRSSSGAWTSGRIETVRTNFAPPSGGGILRVEASIQLPNVTGAAAQGYWPAFWMLGAPFRGVYTNWPIVGEMDILENVNGANQVWGTLHCGTSPGGPCNETSGIGGTRIMGSPSLQTAFHKYTFEWDTSVSPNQLRWYVDGIHYHTVSQTAVDASTWTNATNHGYFIILNVAMGGGWPGNPTSSTTSGAPMKVDYVAVWSKTGSGGGGGSGSEYTYGVNNVDSTQALTWFKPSGFTASYVILHYIRPGITQQNVNMSYSSGTAQWGYYVGGLSSGQTLSYSFTYNKNGVQYDTPTFTWTKP
ncbi:glycoside hydrolase family 16 protein [Archangium sp.]|uniref:glycoside hydrolase family 16 protein n=1 Tax=Archangium sp. TaxID=1872627 RepID=UPI002D2F360C|nr:glycoside hydrolase family 16 protein [Archangium sp.]HYO52646.1 glycoside hydrolase family 16 protein [Archangium sp.]